MANEGRPQEPLAASIGDQLRTKDALDARADEEKRADEQAQARVERHKEAERAEVARHLGAAATPSGWREAREGARERGREEARLRDWGGRGLPLAGIGLALLGFVLRRRWVAAAGMVPLLAGAFLLRNRLPAR